MAVQKNILTENLGNIGPQPVIYNTEDSGSEEVTLDLVSESLFFNIGPDL